MSDHYVIDASALLLALIGRNDSAADLRRRLPAMGRHAPHLIDAEVGNVLRRHERRGLVGAAEAQAALGAARVLIDHRYPHTGRLAELAWSWRASITFYDALYVALAALLDAPLITADTRLSKTPHLPCRVEIV